MPNELTEDDVREIVRKVPAGAISPEAYVRAGHAAALAAIAAVPKPAPEYIGSALTRLFGLPQDWGSLSVVWANDQSYPTVTIELIPRPMVIVDNEIVTAFAEYELRRRGDPVDAGLKG